MNSTIKKVFLIIALLVLVFMIWQIVFMDGGLVQSAYNSVAGVLNAQYAKLAGSNRCLLPTWGTDNSNSSIDNNTTDDGGNMEYSK